MMQNQAAIEQMLGMSVGANNELLQIYLTITFLRHLIQIIINQ